MTETPGYSPRHRVERVVSAGRLTLATFLCVGLLLDPTEPGRHASLVAAIAAAYFVYALALAGITWMATTTAPRLPLATQVADLVLFSVLMHLSDGPASPFFVFFVFATLCGAIRWHGRGALLTGGAALGAYILVTVTGTTYLGTADPDWLRFTTRCAHLATVAGLLAYVGAHQHRLQREIGSLAQWPRQMPATGEDAVRQLLTDAGQTLGARRLVMTWEEGDEPALLIASRDGDNVTFSRERPDTFGELVAPGMVGSSFLCADVQTPSPRVLVRTGETFRWTSGPALDAALQARYAVRSVLALRLAGETVSGWLFVLDRPTASADDLLLGDIVARLVTSTLDLQMHMLQLREAAAGEERLRVARELHDGTLQALTAAALQIQRARDVLTRNVSAAEHRLECVQDIIYTEQQVIRRAVETLNPRRSASATGDVLVMLRECTDAVARQWDVGVHLKLPEAVAPLPLPFLHEIRRMITEALVNAARHGSARDATVECAVTQDSLTLVVEYQGTGFAGLDGRHDLCSLEALGTGPRMLTQRVAALGGSLVVESRAQGARLELVIPKPGARTALRRDILPARPASTTVAQAS